MSLNPSLCLPSTLGLSPLLVLGSLSGGVPASTFSHRRCRLTVACPHGFLCLLFLGSLEAKGPVGSHKRHPATDTKE